MILNFHKSSSRSFHSKKFQKDNVPVTVPPSYKKRFLQLTGLVVAGAVGADYLDDLVYTKAILRFLRSLKTASLISADYFLLFATHGEEEEDYTDLLKAVHLRCANRILQTCLANGGLYIKVGQGVAAINHILPVEYTKTLGKLQNDCMTGEKLDVKKIFEEDFGATPEALFKEFDYSPKAAASLAQVFRAKGKDDEDLAVKVK